MSGNESAGIKKNQNKTEKTQNKTNKLTKKKTTQKEPPETTAVIE